MKFKVGDRIRHKNIFIPPATVTEITERGFKYKLDSPYVTSPRLGLSFDGGEVYLDVYPDYVFWVLESEWTESFSALEMYYCDNYKYKKVAI